MPGEDAALLLALGHGKDARLDGFHALQGCGHHRKIFALRDQAGKPAAQGGELRALRDHTRDEAQLAAGADQLGGFPSEIQLRFGIGRQCAARKMALFSKGSFRCGLGPG